MLSDCADAALEKEQQGCQTRESTSLCRQDLKVPGVESNEFKEGANT